MPQPGKDAPGPESATPRCGCLMPRFYRSRRFWLILLVVAVVAAGLAAFLAFGPPRLFAKSESPEFCGSCHVMESRYEAWFHAGAHRRVKCVDCHLPNDNIVHHLAGKVFDGGQEFLAFHTGRFPEDIQPLGPWRQGAEGQLPEVPRRDHGPGQRRPQLLVLPPSTPPPADGGGGDAAAATATLRQGREEV